MKLVGGDKMIENFKASHEKVPELPPGQQIVMCFVEIIVKNLCGKEHKAEELRVHQWHCFVHVRHGLLIF